MSISLNNAPLSNIEALSAQSQTVLQLIEGGASWLEQAIKQDEPVLEVNSESSLLQQIVSGLYNASTITINTLDVSVSVDKLLSMSSNDLRDLFHLSQQTDGKRAPSFTQLIDTYQLTTNEELANAYSQSKTKGLSGINFPLAGSKVEQKTLLELVQSPKLKNLKKNQIQALAKEADAQAQSFSSYIQLVNAHLERLPAENSRISPLPIAELTHDLIPIISGHLTCPVHPEPPTQLVLDAIIEHWHKAGKSIGVKDVFSAISQLVSNQEFDLNQRAKWPGWTENYLTAAQKCLAASSANDAGTSQFDNIWYYYFDNALGKATLEYRADGCLQLISFIPAN